MPPTIPTVQIKTKYDYALQASLAPGVNFVLPKDKSLTNQADLVNSDINIIMARYEKTGLIMGTERKPMYGDFTEVKNYHEMMVAIKNAEYAFSLLPAAVRGRFNNNPQELIDFLENPANDAEAVKLGLKEKTVLPPNTAQIWDKTRLKWFNSFDGSLADPQNPPPAAPVADPPPAG